MSKMPKYLLVVLAFVQFIFCASLANASDDSIQVTASGIGHTSDEALKDAYKNAVRRAVGVYVLTETVMNNEDIDEKIYANSDGVVSSHEVLETKPLPNNLIEITIKATVQKNNIGRLVGKDKPVVIDKKNIANVSNSLNAMEEVQKSLDLIFKGYPASLLTVEAIGQPVIDETEDVTAGTLPMKQKLRISVNYSEYQKLAKKLEKLFDQMNYPHGYKQPLTSRSIIEFNGKEASNIFFLLTRRNPNSLAYRFEDLNGIGYRLPGQIIRYIRKHFSSPRCFIQLEMVDIESNVLGSAVWATPNVLFRWAMSYVRNNVEDHCIMYDHIRGDLAILWPMCDGIFWIPDYDSWRVLGGMRRKASSERYFTIPFSVNRQMYENAQGLKIQVSIYNEKQEEAISP